MNFYKTSFLIIICVILLGSGGFVFAYQFPTAEAGPDIYVTSGMFNSSPSEILRGSGDNPNGGALNFSWACTGGSLSNYNVPRPLFTASFDVWQSITYICVLTVTDNYGFSSSDSTTIYVNYSHDDRVYNFNIQTNVATNIYEGEATLNANATGTNNIAGTTYGWFQWGPTTSYGYESAHRTIGYVGIFDQHIANLSPSTIYHFRVVAQKNNGEIIYGQDMTFNSSGFSYIGGGQVAGASTISTGLTNNFLTDSFLLPLFIIVMSLWLYFSGNIYDLVAWLKKKTK